MYALYDGLMFYIIDIYSFTSFRLKTHVLWPNGRDAHLRSVWVVGKSCKMCGEEHKPNWKLSLTSGIECDSFVGVICGEHDDGL